MTHTPAPKNNPLGLIFPKASRTCGNCPNYKPFKKTDDDCDKCAWYENTNRKTGCSLWGITPDEHAAALEAEGIYD